MDTNTRPELEADRNGIRNVHLASVPTADEADLVDQLRDNDSLVFSLVAIVAGQVVGHVAFSRMESPERTLGLGPVRVSPAFRRQGIAAGLIREGMQIARVDGWNAVFVLGDPAYYGRFAFSVEDARAFESPYAGPHFMVPMLYDKDRLGQTRTVTYASAFAALG
ncbi:MAG: GNAT family N-acetyltransferase [Thermomicrobiales bacterium]